MNCTGKASLKDVVKNVVETLLRILPDKLYVSLLYFYSYGKFPNLRNPRSFDEKIQWYKLNYRNPEMTVLADKYEVRSFIEKKGLGHILNELYFVKDKLSVADFDGLPENYVIKATHGCGMNIIAGPGIEINKKAVVRRVNRWLGCSHFHHGREWAYKNIKPRVICEEYLENEEHGELVDYKFYCFSGKPEVVFACAGRFSEKGVGYNAYDMDWNQVHIYKGKPGVDINVEKPGNFDEMVKIASELAGDYPFIRVDLYSVRDRIILGELTFYPDSGIIPFTPEEYNYHLGNLFMTSDK